MMILCRVNFEEGNGGSPFAGPGIGSSALPDVVPLAAAGSSYGSQRIRNGEQASA